MLSSLRWMNYLTSQLCSGYECKSKTTKLEKIYGSPEDKNCTGAGKETKKSKSEHNSIYALKSCPDCHCIWNHDHNAVRNILDTFLHMHYNKSKRPDRFCRVQSSIVTHCHPSNKFNRPVIKICH